MDLLIDKHRPVRMRDGVALATDVYRPAGGERLPTLVQRLPYDKESSPLRNTPLDILRAAQAGYAVVVQDTRGRYASEAEFHPFFDEARDGADTIAWAAAQPWSSGAVGMVGGSYFGATQWLAATQAPPALRAFAPFITSADYHEGWTYQGGAFQLGFALNWTLTSLAQGEALRRQRAGRAGPDLLASVVRAIDANPRLYWRLPLVDVPELGDLAPYYAEWLAHPDYDDYWRQVAPRESYERVTAPALNVGGWYDLFLNGTLANYQGMRARGGSPAARRPRLIVGPWAHGNALGFFPERSYGLRAGVDGVDLTGIHLRWFDHWLRGLDNGVPADPPVRLFVMGADEWRDADDWPPSGTTPTPYYLRGGGRANSAAGDGALSPAPPGDEPDDAFLYDPRQPVPTVGGATFLPGLQVTANGGPRDQRGVEARADVLCYTSPPLAQAVEVVGPVELVLFVSSSARDTDFTAKLVDVHPDGRAEILTDGILRARYRESPSRPAPLEPGRVYELRIDVGATANRFKPGHRIRLDVSSSNFPRFDRNTNSGGTIATETEADFVRAVNRVYHDARHPSRLVLPVQPGAGA